MDAKQKQHTEYFYQQHLINLKLQGKRPATVDDIRVRCGEFILIFNKNQTNHPVTFSLLQYCFAFCQSCQKQTTKAWRINIRTMEKLNTGS